MTGRNRFLFTEEEPRSCRPIMSDREYPRLGFTDRVPFLKPDDQGSTPSDFISTLVVTLPSTRKTRILVDRGADMDAVDYKDFSLAMFDFSLPCSQGPRFWCFIT